ncbi:MAG: thymidine phosphorylase, partial [Deltaproteobacteria bacterium]|nr:thymidine phosphorylase [Deltaproteobacteria bacterium]
MNFLSILQQKKEGKEIASADLKQVVEAYVRKEIPDYQMSAFLMAICFRGMSMQELSAWTLAMVESGRRLNLKSLKNPKIDKHSTGGVGDKVSLILAPWVACFDILVPMMAGRSLGFTGGTIDKLESIPGFQACLSESQILKNLQKVGCCIFSQSEKIATADHQLYALRDASGTVESIPLIASSIVSKKVAEGIDGIVYDVKFGAGAFLPELQQARELATALVNLSRTLGLKSQALLTSMEQPLGYAIGNSLEVLECVEVMKGKPVQDLLEVSLALAAKMLVLAKRANNTREAHLKLKKVLKSGAVYQKFLEMIRAQKGEVHFVQSIQKRLSKMQCVSIFAAKKGYVSSIATRAMADYLREVGAGRFQKSDSIEADVGIILNKKLGDFVRKGDLLFQCYLRKNEKNKMALSHFYKINSHQN